MRHPTTSPTTATMTIVVKTGILVLGGFITYFGYKTYRNTRATSLHALAPGLDAATLGATLGGAFDVTLSANLVTGLSIDSVLTSIGLAVIVYSLYVD